MTTNTFTLYTRRLVKLTSGVNFNNILLAQKLPIDLRYTAYIVEVDCIFWLFVMVKVGVILLVTDTVWRRRMTFVLCARRLVKLARGEGSLSSALYEQLLQK